MRIPRSRSHVAPASARLRSRKHRPRASWGQRTQLTPPFPQPSSAGGRPMFGMSRRTTVGGHLMARPRVVQHYCVGPSISLFLPTCVYRRRWKGLPCPENFAFAAGDQRERKPPDRALKRAIAISCCAFTVSIDGTPAGALPFPCVYCGEPFLGPWQSSVSR
jgi:hypothetical protein